MPALAALLTLVTTSSVARTSTAPADLLPSRVDRITAALDARFSQPRAMSLVTFMDQHWRLAGNPGFNASIDEISRRLTAAGFVSNQAAASPHFWVENYPAASPGWDYSVGRLAIAGASGQPETTVLSETAQRDSLCINSFSTPSGGVTAALVDVGRGGRSSDYVGKSLQGAIVLGDAPPATLWQEAVIGHGAAGVISTSLGDYVRPDDVGMPEKPKDQWNVLQWGSVPYDPVRRAFGFKATPQAAAALRARLAAGPVTLHVQIQSSFTPGPDRTLIAEIPGSSHPDQRIVMAAHLQEPGANDDGSGCATLLGMAAALRQAIAEGAVTPPARTLTFMWVDEIRGSRRWLSDHPDEAAGVQYMLSLDMTGEDTSKTGGTFLIEKGPDPSATWVDPADPHTEWYSPGSTPPALAGSLLNDLHLAICEHDGRRTGWVVRTNPYEGGSDHTVYIEDGIPALLNWHFPDRYYHTNLDRPEKTSPLEMQRVAVATATTAELLASATSADALAVERLIQSAAEQRLALEAREAAQAIGAAKNPMAAGTVRLEHRQIETAWRLWYIDALDSVRKLPVDGGGDALNGAIDKAVLALQQGT